MASVSRPRTTASEPTLPATPALPPLSATAVLRRALVDALGSAWLLVVALTFTVFALVTGVLFLIPTPYQVLLPGPVTDVQSLIVPSPHRSKGALLLTTIYSDPASIGEWLYAKTNREAGIVPREEARPTSIDEKQYQKLLVSMMDESKVAAKVVGLRAAGYEVKITGQGAQVQEVAETSKATGILQAGDVIIGANGQPIATADDLIALLRTRRAGETLDVQVKRGEETLTLPVPLGESPDDPARARIGVVVLTHLYEYQLPREVNLQTKDVGGPSGGLMFSLGVYNAVTDDDITRGHKIAGTGTISTDGTVGAVGGVKYKVLAAEKAGAEVFLVPQDNTTEAQQVAHTLRVVPVRTFDDALAALRELSPAT